MYRQVVISFYESDPFEEESNDELLFRRLVITDIPIFQIERLLDIGDGFSLNIVEGETLNFIDFFSFHGPNQEIIDSINSIPSLSVRPDSFKIKCLYLRRNESNGDTVIPRRGITIYQKSRFELGASGFSEFVIYCSNNPWIMLVVGYLLGKIFDYIVQHLLKRVRTYDSKKMLFNCKKFYKLAAKALHCGPSELQITDINFKKDKIYHIRFRNMKGDCFKADCYSNGTIVKLSSK